MLPQDQIICILRIFLLLRVFEISVPKKILGPKTDAVTVNCRRLYNEELHDLYA